MKKTAKRKIASVEPPTKKKKQEQTTLKPFTPKANGNGIFPHPEIHISSWNVNGIRACLKKPSVLEYCARPELDVLCFNETKIQVTHIEEIKSKFPQYPYQYWSCSKTKLGYSGTAILSKVEPISWSEGLKGHPEEGRITVAEFDSFYLLSNYVPNSGSDRFDYRLNKWDNDLRNYIKELEANGKGVIWIGDLNVINLDLDIHKLKGNDKCAGATPEERKSFKETLAAGLVDSFRHLYPDTKKFSWFSMISKGAKSRNEGWRIDMAVVSASLISRLKDSLIYDDVLGSDHHPIEVVLHNSSN